MDYEVEMKFRCEDWDALERRIRQLPAASAGSLEQRDTYFAHPQRDFAQTDEAFRIRSFGEASRVTYKGPKVDASSKTRRELEVALGEGADTRGKMTAMLLCLGFREVLTVVKHRRLYRLRWEDRDIELAMDTVADLGEFVELETIASQSDWQAAKDSIARLAAHLQWTSAERRSYLELLLEATPP
jgi:adenylate cyclase class 2